MFNERHEAIGHSYRALGSGVFRQGGRPIARGPLPCEKERKITCFISRPTGSALYQREGCSLETTTVPHILPVSSGRWAETILTLCLAAIDKNEDEPLARIHPAIRTRHGVFDATSRTPLMSGRRATNACH